MIKIERSFPAPSSLAAEAAKNNGSYEKPDVVERLKEDFHNKCYICELKNLQGPQVEHLLPHKNGKYHDRKFDWNNLFWACGHCNGVKNQRKYDSGILDCCKIDPEQKIIFRLKQNDIELLSTMAVPDEETKRTMELVREVFNLRNTGLRVYKSDMRFKELQKEMNCLFDNLEKLKADPKSPLVLRKLRALLKREAAFAAFKRCYVREHLSDYPQLATYIQ
ncbi:MAG: hypothetical protein HFI29_13130 [Lachnospiraceae bacterium]|jgi:uncharacterized protein (TIGR02646 family)|nr:hypothetical protein [Lachnospiraceae bacterium]